MKKSYLIGFILLAALAVFSVSAFKESLTPYVSYEQARGTTRAVQVAGGLEQGSSVYTPADEALRFTLKEQQTGDTLRVSYKGLKPANFEEAISIVAIGKYDRGVEEFHADKLLVKCPSKYQGAEVEEKVYE